MSLFTLNLNHMNCAVALLTVPQLPTAHKLRGNVPQ